MTTLYNFPHRFHKRLKGFVSAVCLFALFCSLPIPASAGGQQRLIDPDKLAYKPLHFQPPKAERVRLDNGMILYVLEDRELPLVNLTMVVRTGSMYDPQGKEGLAELTGKVMRTGGAGNLSGSAMDEALEYVAASIEPATAMESTSWNLGVMKKDLDRGMGILSKIIQEPLFNDLKLKLAQDLKLEELRRLIDDPQKLGFREFNRLLYQGNARGRLSTPSSIKKITREDLIAFHRGFYFPGNIMIAMAGDISRDEAVQKMNDYFGQWNLPGRIAEIPPPSRQPSGQIYYLVKDVPQSLVVAGQFAPAKTSPDYFPFEALDFMIGGGGFRSRIFQEIRTNRGLAYSAGSFYRARTDYGVFGAYAMTKTESAPLVLTLIKSILEQSRKELPDPKELVRTKNAIINSFIFEYRSSKQVADQQMMIEYNRLPENFLSTYCDHIQALTTQDLKAVGFGQLRPDDMAILILGTADGYEKLKETYKNIQKIGLTYD